MNELQPDSEQLKIWWVDAMQQDTLAFGRIHKSLYAGLFNYALKLLGDEALANDVIQDLFIKIWNKRHSIGELQKVKAYFFTALRRQVLNQLRDLKLRQLKISTLASPDIDFSQEEILIQREQDNALKSRILLLLNSLPSRQKEVIYLSFFEDMSNAQIAEVLDINYQSVMNLKQRALQKMRTLALLLLLTILPFLF